MNRSASPASVSSSNQEQLRKPEAVAGASAGQVAGGPEAEQATCGGREAVKETNPGPTFYA